MFGNLHFTTYNWVQIQLNMPFSLSISLAKDTSLLLETPSLSGLQPIFDC